MSSLDTGCYVHGDSDYKDPGAAWNDVSIVTTGGKDLTIDGVSAGYGKIAGAQRLRNR